MNIIANPKFIYDFFIIKIFLGDYFDQRRVLPMYHPAVYAYFYNNNCNNTLIINSQYKHVHICTHLMLNECFLFLIFICLNIPEMSHCYGNVFTSCESVLCSLYSSNRVFVTCSNSLLSLLVVSMKRCLLSSCASDENK